MMKRIKDSDGREISRRYQNGESSTSLAEEFGCSKRGILWTVRKNGGIVRPAGANRNYLWLTDEKKTEMVDSYKKHHSAKKAAEEFGVDASTISRIAVELGVPINPSGRRPTYKINHRSFDRITAESAYWIGFLMADGCVTDRGKKGCSLRLQLSECDRGHIVKFRSFLGADNPIRQWHESESSKRNHYIHGSPQAILDIYSRPIVLALKGFGVVPRKSVVAKVDSRLADNADFWRGMVDGDGALFMTGKPKSMPRISLVGSRDVVAKFSDFCRSRGYSGSAKPRKCQSGKIWEYAINGTHAVKICRVLYHHCKIALDRKLKTYRQFTCR